MAQSNSPKGDCVVGDAKKDCALLVFDICAKGGDLVLVHMAMFSDGSVKWHDGSKWNDAAPADGQWDVFRRITLRIGPQPTNGTTVEVGDGVYPVGRVNPYPKIDSVAFRSAGTDAMGDVLVTGIQFADDF